MKVPVSDLVRLVNELVEKRIKELLPGAVAKHLSEQYVRKLVAEGGGKPTRLRQVMEAEDPEEEPTPQPRTRTEDKGIYNDGAKRLTAPREAVSLIAAGNSILESVLADVRPISQIEAEAGGAADGGIPVEQLQQATGLDFSRMARVAALAANRTPAPPSRAVAESAALSAKEEELARRRKLLEVRE